MSVGAIGANLDSFMSKPLVGIGKEIKGGQEATPDDLLSGFGKILKNNLNKVNDLQLESDVLTQKLATGEVENVHGVMIAAQKAEISLNFMMEIRSKAIRAYQELMTMK